MEGCPQPRAGALLEKGSLYMHELEHAEALGGIGERDLTTLRVCQTRQ